MRRRAGVVRTVLGGLLLVLAAGVMVLTTLLTYALTSEYGASPNDDPAADLTRAAMSHVVASLVVAGLTAAGLELVTRMSLRRRLTWVASAFVAAFALLGAGLALGQRALDERCAGPERSSTGAC